MFCQLIGSYVEELGFESRSQALPHSASIWRSPCGGVGPASEVAFSASPEPRRKGILFQVTELAPRALLIPQQRH